MLFKAVDGAEEVFRPCWAPVIMRMLDSCGASELASHVSHCARQAIDFLLEHEYLHILRPRLRRA